MILQVVQTMQDMYAADFLVKRKDAVVGWMEFRGSVGSRDGRWLITRNQNVYLLKRDSQDRNGIPTKAYRPYQIQTECGMQGAVFDLQINEGIFIRYNVDMVYLNDQEYIMYPIGFGTEGCKNPVYHNGKQIAQIEKGSKTYHALHQYRVLAVDENAADIALLLCSYMYTCAAYQPGVRVTASEETVTTVTTNRKLKSFYNPTFSEKIEE